MNSPISTNSQHMANFSSKSDDGQVVAVDDKQKLILAKKCFQFIRIIEKEITAELTECESFRNIYDTEFEECEQKLIEMETFDALSENLRLHNYVDCISNYSVILLKFIVFVVNGNSEELIKKHFRKDKNMPYSKEYDAFPPALTHFCLQSFQQKFSYDHFINGNIPVLQCKDQYIEWHVATRLRGSFLIPSFCLEKHAAVFGLFGPDYEFMQSLDMDCKISQLHSVPTSNTNDHSDVGSKTQVCHTTSISEITAQNNLMESDDTLLQKPLSDNQLSKLTLLGEWSKHRCHYVKEVKIDKQWSGVQCKKSGTACLSCQSRSPHRINRYYCIEHKDCKKLQKKNAPRSQLLTIHEDQILYASWRSLLKHSPHLCHDANVTTTGFRGKYTLDEAVSIIRKARIMVMDEMVPVSYDMLFAPVKKLTVDVNSQKIMRDLITLGVKRRAYHNDDSDSSYDSDESENSI